MVYNIIYYSIILIKFLNCLSQKMAEEEVTFSSKRKQEYESLIKQPCYSETQIRVIFPHEIVFEAIFAPKETIEDLVKLI